MDSAGAFVVHELEEIAGKQCLAECDREETTGAILQDHVTVRYNKIRVTRISTWHTYDLAKQGDKQGDYNCVAGVVASEAALLVAVTK